MLVPFHQVIDEATARGGAAAAFTCYDLETARGVLDAAAELDRSVLILVSASSVRGTFGIAFLTAIVAFATGAEARACVEVDHIDDLEIIAGALELGAGAVMADGSRLSFDENVAFVRSAVALASASGAAVEAELGRVEGDEDRATLARDGKLTDPGEAERFVRSSRVDCLAVSIGNVHGRYTTPPELDWGRLEAIRSEVAVPLALHGASGIPDPAIRQAVTRGIGKINVNTELREAYLAATVDALEHTRGNSAVADLHSSQAKAVAAVVTAKLRLYEQAGER